MDSLLGGRKSIFTQSAFRTGLIDRSKITTKPFGESGTSSVVLKPDALESSKIVKYQPVKKEAALYEPTTLEEYIGQDQAKDQIRTAINVIQQLKPVHIMFNGWVGCGKTTLAKITANMLKARFIYRVPEQLEDVDKLLETINIIQSSEQLSVFMVDEIHTLCKFPRVANVMLPILQEGKYGDAYIRPFVMIGATTDLDMLMKRQSPLVSRFQFKITLDKYTPQELAVIIKNYKNASFKDWPVQENDYRIIAQNSRGIPREAIALLLKQLVTKDIDKVLKQSRIIKDGLTEIDIKILMILAKNEKPMGANYLSQAAGIPQADYEAIYERYLVEQGYLARLNRGRLITQKGKELLMEVKNA